MALFLAVSANNDDAIDLLLDAGATALAFNSLALGIGDKTEKGRIDEKLTENGAALSPFQEALKRGDFTTLWSLYGEGKFEYPRPVGSS